MMTSAIVPEQPNDLAAACARQQRFLRYSTPEINTLTFSARCRQAGKVGGDCCDFLPLPENRLALLVGDASGKGQAAAMMMSRVQSLLLTAALCIAKDAPAVLGAVNRQVHASSLDGRYATLFYGLFDVRSRSLHYVNAGHNPPMVLRPDRSILWLETGGLPLGMFPGSNYSEGAVQLRAGDLVVAYTDGVVEAVNPAGEEWGAEGLRKAAFASRTQCAQDIVQSIFASMDEYSPGRQADDATVAILQVH